MNRREAFRALALTPGALTAVTVAAHERVYWEGIMKAYFEATSVAKWTVDPPVIWSLGIDRECLGTYDVLKDSEPQPGSALQLLIDRGQR